MNILLTSAGRRVALLRSFRRALNAKGSGRVLAADVDVTAPALWEADKGFQVGSVSSEQYVEELLQICTAYEVDAIVPLIDPELPVLAKHQEKLRAAGVVPMVGQPEAVQVAYDKLLTAQFFLTHGIPTARTWRLGEFRAIARDAGYPVILKSRYGSAGRDVYRCEALDEVEFYANRLVDPIVQEYLRGPEVTVDVFGDGSGQLISLIPRKRLKIRAGEVERGITVNHEPFLSEVTVFAKAYKPYGAVNVQCFITEDGPMFTEVNARFGGGYPLADAAGARFPELLVELVEGRELKPCVGGYEVGLVMSRYDDAVFMPAARLPGGERLTALSVFGE